MWEGPRAEREPFLSREMSGLRVLADASLNLDTVGPAAAGIRLGNRVHRPSQSKDRGRDSRVALSTFS